MEELSKQCVSKFGYEKQMYQTVEELSELQKEILKFANRSKLNRREILEEYIDVNFMLLQLKEMLHFTQEEISEMENIKAEKIREVLCDGD